MRGSVVLSMVFVAVGLLLLYAAVRGTLPNLGKTTGQQSGPKSSGRTAK